MDQLVERDGRAMNRMDPETKIVHAKLEAWGSWAREAHLRAYPPSTLLGRMIEFGAQGSSQQGRPPVSMPDEIAHVDAAVAKLGDIDRRAVLAYYTYWDAPEICAKRARLSLRQFQNVLRRARWRIHIFLLNVYAQNGIAN